MQPEETLSVGIVIRTKDRPVFVSRALASVQAQTYPHWKVALVNDGGDPATLAEAIAAPMAAPCAATRITLHNLDPGRGRSAAFNHGLASLDTDFVACLDDDDTWDPQFLQALVAFYTQLKPDITDLGGVAAKVTALKEEITETLEGPALRVIGEDTLPRAFHRGEFFLNPLAYACYRQDMYPVQWILRRDAVLASGGFPESFDVMEDRAFMNRFLGRHRLAIFDRKLAFHHRRVQRAQDQTRNILMNTLDNPSYDWRRFADLARPGVDLSASDRLFDTIRSSAADLLSEMNYETSAIWQKVDGEFRALDERLNRDRLDVLTALEGILRFVSPEAGGPPARPATPPVIEVAAEARVFDLWHAVGQTETAAHVSPGQTFAERLAMSRQLSEEGQLLQLDPTARRLALQLPDTGTWSAVEITLADLVEAGRGLTVHLALEAPHSYLFETALISAQDRGDGGTDYRMSDITIHKCAGDTGCVIRREISAAWLGAVAEPKLSIILPRRALNFCFTCRDLVIERV